VAEKIAAFARATGGVMTVEDLADFQPEWVAPLSVRYRGHDIWELPPNGQGLVALMALQILEGLHAGSVEERIHYQIEALKLGFADAAAYVTDPRYMPWPADTFLTPGYAAERRALISGRAVVPQAGVPVPSGTVYLCTADGDGNMVSFIQSNYRGFGSGLVVPGTGIALQNRGELFTLDGDHPNSLEPGKRPFHTIIPGFVTRDGKPLGPFGVMGGFMQPQGHVQVMSRVLDEGMNPQAALDAPRFYWREKNCVAVESTMPDHIVQDLRRRGHEVDIEPMAGLFGRGEIIWRDEDGVLAGGTEPRADGQVAVW
jgi:gamma-glutamyltranspeptidase/glutathione hydrolase